MPYAQILQSLANKGAEYVFTRPTYSAAGALIGYDVIDDSGSIIGSILPDELNSLEEALNALGVGLRNLAGAIGNEILEVIEGAGEALVKGLDRTFNYIGDRFIRGREPDIIAGFTIVILSIGAGVYLYNSMKSANDAFS